MIAIVIMLMMQLVMICAEGSVWGWTCWETVGKVGAVHEYDRDLWCTEDCRTVRDSRADLL